MHKLQEDVLKKAERILFFLMVISMAFLFVACHKKKPIEPTPTAPPPAAAPTEQEPSTVKQSQESGPQEVDIEEITRKLQPVFFDYNKADVRADMVEALQNNARVLKENPTVSVLIEGHCDERGTEEYNLALGERRANAAKDYIVGLGIAENRLSIISYGESRPFATGHDEDSWKLNRRAHFVAVKK